MGLQALPLTRFHCWHLQCGGTPGCVAGGGGKTEAHLSGSVHTLDEGCAPPTAPYKTRAAATRGDLGLISPRPRARSGNVRSPPRGQRTPRCGQRGLMPQPAAAPSPQPPPRAGSGDSVPLLGGGGAVRAPHASSHLSTTPGPVAIDSRWTPHLSGPPSTLAEGPLAEMWEALSTCAQRGQGERCPGSGLLPLGAGGLLHPVQGERLDWALGDPALRPQGDWTATGVRRGQLRVDSL